MIDTKVAERELAEGLKAILETKKAEGATDVADAVKPAFAGIRDGAYPLVAVTQVEKYRLRDAVSHAGGFPKGDKLAQVRVVKLGSPLFTALDTPLYDTKGLLDKDLTVFEVEQSMHDRLHDHTLEHLLEQTVWLHLGKPLLSAVQKTVGEHAPSLVETVLCAVRILVLAKITRQRELFERTASMLRVSPGTLLLGRHVDERRSVKENGVCNVLALS